MLGRAWQVLRATGQLLALSVEGFCSIVFYMGHTGVDVYQFLLSLGPLIDFGVG